jgi:choloylglycine hydrolase
MDATGDCIVLEHVDGELVVHENPIGVITNSPSFDWHITNLKNYVNLSAVNREPMDLDGLDICEMGMGSGLLGMPGDFTPPSRFIRAVVYSLSSIPARGSDEAVLQSFHILNQFDIPVGACRRQGQDGEDSVQYEYTLWSSVSDLERCRYYIRTHDDSSIRMVDLRELDPEGTDVLLFGLGDHEDIQDITESAEPMPPQ